MSYKKCVISEKCILTINLSAQSANLNATNELECYKYTVALSENRVAPSRMTK